MRRWKAGSYRTYRRNSQGALIEFRVEKGDLYGWYVYQDGELIATRATKKECVEEVREAILG